VEDEIQPLEEDENWRMQTLAIGAVIGALTGITAAYLFVQRAEREKTRPKVTPGEGIKLGLLLLGALRQIAQLGE
jgi:hypothetical protein